MMRRMGGGANSNDSKKVVLYYNKILYYNIDGHQRCLSYTVCVIGFLPKELQEKIYS
jgi:hypothetical protein